MVSKVDQSVGRIIRALEISNILENSIIIFYSESTASSVGQFANSGSNWPLRGQKNTPWEGGLRVGGVIWSPLLSGRSTVFRQPMYVADWFPTLAQAAGIKLDPSWKLDGIGLWSKLMEEKVSTIVERDIVHYMDDQSQVVSLMHGLWKYINGTTSHGAYDNVLTFRELYDLDPRSERYVLEVRNSVTSQALKNFDEQRLSIKIVQSLRHKAGTRCYNDLERTCNPLLEECLFNIEHDPCERNNLAAVREFRPILQTIRSRVHNYQNSVWPIINRNGVSEYAPTRPDCQSAKIL